MRRSLAVLLVVISVASGAGSAAAGPRTVRYNYVANSSVWTNIDEPLDALDTPVGKVAANGYVRFAPTSRPKTLTVHDLGATAGGTVAVKVVQRFPATRTERARVGASFFKCLSVNVPITLRGFTKGGEVEIVVAGDGWVGMNAPQCSAHAIGGDLTVAF
jgi:hypothetical protein